jgi:hypothetical protein
VAVVGFVAAQRVQHGGSYAVACCGSRTRNQRHAGRIASQTKRRQHVAKRTSYYSWMSTDAQQSLDIPVQNDTAAERLGTDAYTAWHHALKELTGDRQRFDSWRKQRYAFAHRVGILLTEAHPPSPVVTGPALYGVYLAGTGLCYVGQTQEAKRRLRDLPIGESHHLAVTVPPELWTRVIVVQWAELLAPAAGDHDWAIANMKACGEALEYLLHCNFHPPINCHTRTKGGSYRERPPENSKSKAAISSASFSHLFKVVLGAWSDLEAIADPAPDDGRIADYSSYGRVIFPSALSASSNLHQTQRVSKGNGLPSANLGR